MTKLSENALCEKLGLKNDQVRKLRRQLEKRLELKIGKKQKTQQGKSLALKEPEGYNRLLRWEIRRHGGSILDVEEQSERVSYNKVGRRYKFLHRSVKRVKGAEHLKMTKWILSKDAPVQNEEDLSLMVINLVAIKDTIDSIFK